MKHNKISSLDYIQRLLMKTVENTFNDFFFKNNNIHLPNFTH